jgi:hypothetical protein
MDVPHSYAFLTIRTVFIGRVSVAKEGNKLHFFEVKYQEKVSASEFQWFKKISPKGRRLSVITKQDFKKDKSISLMPAPVFLLRNVAELE